MGTIQSEKHRNGISKARQEEREKSKCCSPKKEEMSKREWEDLMGMHRYTYYQKNGSVRSR